MTGSPIYRGYEWRQRVKVTGDAPAFPAGCALRAQVRDKRTSSTALATLTTGNGGIVRVSDTEIDFVIPDTNTGAMAPGLVYLDLERTDLPSPQHFGFALRINVVQPVTRPE